MAQIETGENVANQALQTRYFKASYDEVKTCYLEFLKEKKHKLLSVNDDYSEIFSEGGSLTCTAKVIMQTPKETSIDFYISSDAFLGGNKAKNFIKAAWDYIAKKYELKGVSLHK